MKILLATLALSFTANTSFAGDILRNCFEDSGRAQYFVSELEDIHREGDIAVLILNEKQQVAGVISVSPERNPDTQKVSKVTVKLMELCSSLEVDTFYYADDLAENLLDWTKGEVEITQDEGKIELNAEVVKQEGYATLVGVDFVAYDVFDDGAEDRDEDGWGMPKGKGRFYYYIPKEWK